MHSIDTPARERRRERFDQVPGSHLQPFSVRNAVSFRMAAAQEEARYAARRKRAYFRAKDKKNRPASITGRNPKLTNEIREFFGQREKARATLVALITSVEPSRLDAFRWAAGFPENQRIEAVAFFICFSL
jgi:hypothetical protein